MKKFEGNTVTVKYNDIKFLCEICSDIPYSVYRKFPIIDDNELDEEYSFDDKNVVIFLRYCDEILDYDEYMNKDLVELYNSIDFLNCKYDILDSNYGELNKKILSHNISEIKSIIKNKEKGNTYRK